MGALVFTSLIVNVVVLVPVTGALVADATWVRSAYGPKQPARQILLAIYLAILTLSGGLLFWQEVNVVMGLLLAQIVYKVLTPITVGTLKNPVVISNLAIAGLHSLTVASLM